MNPIKAFGQQNKKAVQIWGALVLVSVLFTIVQIQGPRGGKAPPAASIDTLIPEGFVLLPIDLSNTEALDGFLHSKGVVDLYTGDPSYSHSEKAAAAVKIIRSPHNPNRFAVLVPEEKAPFLIERFKSFYAIIQNPSKKGVKITPPPARAKKRRIIIESEALSLTAQ